jgi:hypothetical protein
MSPTAARIDSDGREDDASTESLLGDDRPARATGLDGPPLLSVVGGALIAGTVATMHIRAVRSQPRESG